MSTRLNIHVPQRAQPWLLLAPCGLFIVVLVAATIMIFRLSLGVKGSEWDVWTISNYIQIFQHRLYLSSIILTFKLAFLSTIIVVGLSVPIAVVMVRTKSVLLRRFTLFVLLLPLLVNLLVQSYGWVVLLSPSGLINRVLIASGLTDRPILMLFNELGVLIGLVQTTFPLAVFPIAGALRNVSASLEEAAMVLGARRIRAFFEIALPLALPGILAGSTLVFAFNASGFVIPLLLGGGRVPMMATVISTQMGPLLDWPFGAAYSVVLMFITLISLSLYQWFAAASPLGKSSR